ncbi:MAG: RNB domain-containing ribonuclease [Campylobacterota bacterium]
MYKFLFEKILKKQTNFTKEELKKIEELKKQSFIIESNGEYELNSKYKVGTLEIKNKIAVLRDLQNEHRDIRLDFEHLNKSYNGDFVLAKRVFNPRSRIKAKIIKVLDGKKSEVLVYTKNRSFYTVKENIKLNSNESMKYDDDELLLVNSDDLSLIKKIGNIKDPSVDEYISLHLYNEKIRLKKPIEVDAKMDDNSSKRVDLTNLPFCTIDPSSAKDHDDAIYYDKKESILYVAIADVSYFVKQNSALDKEAFKKSTSIYLPSKVLPMLPKELSEQMCSLKEKENRYAYVFKIYLDLNNLSIKKSELFEAVINSHKNFSYGRIDRVLDGKYDNYSSIEKEIFDYVTPLYDVTKKFRSKRLQKGYDFRSVENRIKLKNNKLETVCEESSTASHQLIEECMLLANIEASRKVNSVGIFRIHEEPSLKAISKLVDDVNILGLNVKLKNNVHDTIVHIQQKARNSVLSQEVDELIIQSQTQAKYSSTNLGHFGLGFNSYSHFTSPIRRYADLVLHRILKTKKTPKNIDDICEYISTNEREVDKLVWDFEDRKYARWANDNIGADIKVKIVDIQRTKAVCYDKIKGMKVTIENYKGQNLFTKLKVKIVSANIITKEIIAQIKY